MKKAVVKPKRKRVTFQIKATPGSEVFVAGSFNDWDPQQHQLRDNPDTGHYKATLTLPPGRHEYKFIVDGDWSVDPNGAATIPNTQGSLNSVVEV